MPDLEKAWVQVLNDFTRGSSLLFVETLNLLEAFAREGEDVRPRLAAMREAHPTMALFIKLEHALSRKDRVTPEDLRSIRTAFQKAQDRAIQHGVERLLKLRPAKILTYSYSGMVLEVLRRLREPRPTVIISEGRPDLEGKVLAEQIADLGYDVVYTTDMGLFGLLQDVRLVLVGTDAVVPWGVVNKAGTSGVCAVAQRMKKEVLALSLSFKFLTIQESRRFAFQDAPDGLWDNPPPNVTTRVPLFDVTPFDDFSGIITENGVLSPTEARLLTEQEVVW